MKRALLVVAILGVLQGAAWLAWRAVSASNAPFEVATASGEAPPPAPRDGLLHVWATWCVPCRDELPGLLEAARAEGVSLVAVSVDENPASVSAFFGGSVPTEVVRDPSVAGKAGVRDLPVTLRVEDGRLVERVEGARDWSSGRARSWLRSASRRREDGR